ncbi:MAG: ATP-binding protein [Firmicutes bacterium]|nr:ATP-binding protein [Bacillota bacterium]
MNTEGSTLDNSKNNLLYQYCLSFPPEPPNEIFRETLIRNLSSFFSEKRKSILINGVSCTGKTVLLSQFARYYSDNTFSFFVGDDYWTSTVSRFLAELCEQMIHTIAINGKYKQFEDADLSELNEYDLKSLFAKLYSNLRKHVRKTSKPFYFVIDGLDKIPQNEESILQFIPSGESDGIFILTSGIIREEYNFKYEAFPIQWFSREETIKYLSPFLKENQAAHIFEVCEGMPGYLNEVYRQLSNGIAPETLLDDLPPDFELLLEQEWQKNSLKEDLSQSVLATIVFGPESFSLFTLSQIFNVSIDDVKRIVQSINFLNIDQNTHIIHLVKAYKKFLTGKLGSKEDQIRQLLVDYYEGQEILSSNAFTHLPQLYRESNNFQGLDKLLNIESTVNFIANKRQTSLVRRNLRTLAEMAYSRQETQVLARSILTESLITNVITSPSIIEQEVKAMLTLGYTEDALKCASRCLLAEDRLQVLSRICNHIWDKDAHIPNEVISLLEESIDLLDTSAPLNTNITKKILTVCADLFPIKAELAEKLFAKIAMDKKLNKFENNLMEIILSDLSHVMKQDDDTIDRIRDEVSNESIYQFAGTVSTIFSKKTCKNILEQVEQLSNTSTKLFLLQSWCNSNPKRSNAVEVVDRALQLIIESEEYSPTQLHLRQIAQPLYYCQEYERIKPIINTIDLLKASAIMNPIDEYVRLELLLSAIESKFGLETGTERFFGVYLLLDQTRDTNMRCFILIRMLQNIKYAVPDDSDLEKELRGQLCEEYNNLLVKSASHFKITKKILSAVTHYDKSLAIQFGLKLNLEARRDEGLNEILKAYTINTNSDNIDIDFIIKTLGKVSNIYKREWILVKIMQRLSEHTSVDRTKKIKLVGKVLEITTPAAKTYALAYLYNWIYDHSDAKLNETLSRSLKGSLKKIDMPTEKTKIGGGVVPIIAEVDEELAKQIFEMSNKWKRNSTFCDDRLLFTYTEMIRLGSRMVPDIIYDDNSKGHIDLLCRLIEQIPSTILKCTLFSELALRCLYSGRKDLFKMVADTCLDHLDKCVDSSAKADTLVNISAMLFEHEREILFEKLEDLPIEVQDLGLSQVVKYILSDRPPLDPFETENITTQIDYGKAQKICDVIDAMCTDSMIYTSIIVLVNSLVKENTRSQLDTKLQEKQLLRISQRINDIIKSKLPDNRNICHQGYRIAAQACICKLRDAAKSYRASKIWDTMCPSWGELDTEIKKIENSADKVFVYQTVGILANGGDSCAGERLVRRAEENLDQINNHIDRAERFHLVAKGYSKISKQQAAEFVLKEAVKFAQVCSHGEGRDQIMGGIIELAHSMNQSLASDIASQIDNHGMRSQINQNLIALNLHSDPYKLSQYQKEEFQRVLNSTLRKLLKSICSGRGLIQHEDIVRKWLFNVLGQDFETVCLAVSWLIENNIAGNKPHSRVSNLTNLFYTIMELSQMINTLDSLYSEVAVSNSNNNLLDQILLSNIKTFSVGQGKEAISEIRGWLSKKASNYVKIYDPHFNEEGLILLTSLSQDVRIQILTSLRESELKREKIQMRYEQYWKQICDQSPPPTTIYIYSTPSGRTPLHDRYILTAEAGLQLGTSINGFGKRDSSIQFLDIEEKTQVENEFVNYLILNPPLSHQDDTLTMTTFSL